MGASSSLGRRRSKEDSLYLYDTGCCCCFSNFIVIWDKCCILCWSAQDTFSCSCLFRIQSMIVLRINIRFALEGHYDFIIDCVHIKNFNYGILGRIHFLPPAHTPELKWHS